MPNAAQHEDSLQGWRLETSYLSLPEAFYTRIAPTPVKAPRLVIFNHALGESLGLTLDTTEAAQLAQIFSGNVLAPNSCPLAQAYAGHQFGHFNRLGDGRAHLVGEHLTPDGARVDIQLKGSGQTPYSRRGDGRAALGPMLREYLISEAMHALHIPTTRSLAVVVSGEPVLRETMLQGAILTRVAASHLRVGTFEYAAVRDDRAGLKALADYAIARHYPELLQEDQRYHAFLNAVIAQQASLIAAWMQVGFIHGVMNTDNMTISGETIDYGPCAFMDGFTMDRVFSSIDQHGRYAYGNQPSIARWNLARFAETLLPLLHEDMPRAIAIAEEAIEQFDSLFNAAWLNGMRNKLGIEGEDAADLSLIQRLFEWMQQSDADFTATFRDLMEEGVPSAAIYQSPAFAAWHGDWQARLARTATPRATSLNLMRAHNPIIIPRNQHVEDALAAAQEGDMELFHRLLAAVQRPFEETEANREFRLPPAHSAPNYQTFCGT
jgi:uncharacterized protein YdiU (UPF0061 family)